MIAAPVMDDRLLAAQLRWFVRLRWLAGLAVLAVGLADRYYFKWYQPDLSVSVTGLAILAYNLVLLVMLHRPRFGDLPAGVRVWTQVLPDLVCLALLLAWTGGVFSPLMGFFALHMVIASLLMTRRQAYAAALVAVALIVGALAINHNLPTADGTSPGRLILGGLGLSLLVIVFLANQITDALRRQRTRLHHRNRRIRALLQDLRHQQERLVHHEKMVAMGQMAAGVAHEIANPLANMDSILQLAQRNPAQLTDKKIEALRQQVRRIELTIRQMTEFAHPTDSKWKWCALSDVVDQAIDMLRFDRRRK